MSNTGTIAQNKTAAADAMVQANFLIPQDLSVRAKIIAAKLDVTLQSIYTEGTEIRVSQLEKQLEESHGK